MLNISFRQPNARGYTIDDTTDRWPVTFSPGGEVKRLAEGVTGHVRLTQTSRLRNKAAQQLYELGSGVDRHHPNEMITGIDVVNFASYTSREV